MGRVIDRAIEPLGLNNFVTWQARMKFLLVSKDLWSAVEATAIGDVNAKALAAIGLHVTDEHLPTVVECASAKEAWDKLTAMHKSHSTARMLQLLRELNTFRKEPAESIATYVNRAKQLRQELLGVSHDIKPVELASRLLAGLPKEYEMLVTVLETSPQLDLESVIARLMETEAKMKLEIDDETKAYAAVSRRGARGSAGHQTENRTCYICEEKGHISRDCPQRRRFGHVERNLAL